MSRGLSLEDSSMLRATSVVAAGSWTGEPADSITLEQHDRHRRRIAMKARKGLDFLLDLPDAVALRHGDGLRLEDGRIIEVVAAPEPLVELRTVDAAALTRVAWHLGNRHTPTELMRRSLRIRRDSVLEDLARSLGAQVIVIEAPFNPEGGAYLAAVSSAQSRSVTAHDHLTPTTIEITSTASHSDVHEHGHRHRRQHRRSRSPSGPRPITRS